MDIKLCYKCNITKPVSEFNKDKHNPSGYYSKCKSCCKEYKQEHYKKNKETIRAKKRLYDQEIKESGDYIIPENKGCPRCKVTKPIDEFSIKRTNINMHAKWCKSCHSEYIKTYKNKPKIKVDKITCARCSTEKPTSEFNIDNNNITGHCKTCRECQHILLEIKRDKPKETIFDKECVDCHMIKLVSEFHQRKDSDDGYQDQCRECRNKCNKIRKDIIRNSPKIVRTEKRCYTCKLIKPISEFSKRVTEPDGHRGQCKKCDKIHNKNYHSDPENKLDINTNRRERLKEDINFRIICLTRNEINYAIRNNIKCAHTTELIGIPVDEYRIYLQWTADMNGYVEFDINNFDSDKWNIDHIIPCFMFNMLYYNQQRECFFFMNTQILSEDDHIKKNAKESSYRSKHK